MKALPIILLFFIGYLPIFAQDATCQTEVSPATLSSMLGGRQIYQSFRVDGKGGQVDGLEFNVVMREGYQYHFNLHTEAGGADGIIMKVYSRRTKERIIDNLGGGTSPNTSMTYNCKETGLYDIKFTFKGSKNYCGVCISSFSK